MVTERPGSDMQQGFSDILALYILYFLVFLSKLSAVTVSSSMNVFSTVFLSFNLNSTA